MKPHIVTEDMRLRARDGQELEGKLYLPRDGVVSRLVVQVNGSGPQTCNTFRDRGDGTTYSFCGFFGEELAGRGLGFFCYSTRGCTDGDQGPLYCRVTGQSTAPTPLRPVWPTWRTGPPSFRPTPAVLGRSSCCWGGARGP